MSSATSEFKEQLREAFRQLQPGQVFTFRRTFTEGDVTQFCGVTGDYNPYHIDDLFARESWYGRRIIPGLLTGSMITHIGGLLGFIAMEMNFRYVAPVYVGDTVTCAVTITEKDEARRLIKAHAAMVNQDGLEVLESRFEGFPSLIRIRQNG
jgi:3-hydroxybutyryl-CoA dehydratase